MTIAIDILAQWVPRGASGEVFAGADDSEVLGRSLVWSSEPPLVQAAQPRLARSSCEEHSTPS